MTDIIAARRAVANGIHLPHLRDHVIRPTLDWLEQSAGGTGWSGQAVERLLIGTALAESQGGRYLHQIGGGPALGIYQMEPATHDDIWANYLAYRDRMSESVGGFLPFMVSKESPSIPASSIPLLMAGNLFYATAMCRVHYRRAPAPIPAVADLNGMGNYWKRYYNTALGAGDAAKFTTLLRAAVEVFGI